MAKILAEQHNYHINENQVELNELVANGMCNLIGPLFGSFCCSASLSRSLVQSSAGGFTQKNVFFTKILKWYIGELQMDLKKCLMVGLFSCILVLIVLLYIGPLFHALPNCILACIVIVTLKGMFKQFYDMVRLWRLCKRDFVSFNDNNFMVAGLCLFTYGSL
ncbi:hypothetical protein KUTeg_021073 [Tegillarca granosa]|uniref:SLC26A/SulP transporter domain-containing protein n=1 Tax=Tegillarca granosa TaxID=220873 RepID=A0ABQ9ECD8_TEGGR|nr:hypothetical protein KUTeg_021073 [Tegillarca granosa]